MQSQLSLAELARRLGEPLEVVARWRESGLVGEEPFGFADLERLRLIRLLLRRGAAVEDIVARLRSGELEAWLRPYLEARFSPLAAPSHSLEEAAAASGLAAEHAEQLWAVLSTGDRDDPLSDDDVAVLRLARAAIDAGFPPEAMLQVARVFADALARATEAASRLFHLHVHEPVRLAGLSASAEHDWMEHSRQRLDAISEPIALYFFRRGFLRAARQDAVVHLAAELGMSSSGEAPGEIVGGFVFVDLASFTPLAESMGDRKAAEILDRFGRIVRDEANQWSGRIVKQIGDAFMVTFHDPASAVAFAVEVEHAVQSEPHFPAAQAGVHWGRALYQDGDYVGATVNLAARLADAAERHEVLVSADVCRSAGDVADLEFVPAGRRRLKGIAEEVEVFRARSRSHAPVLRRVDPVCGMELAAGEEAARLDFDDREHVFCSQTCLRRFVAAPEKYH